MNITYDPKSHTVTAVTPAKAREPYTVVRLRVQSVAGACDYLNDRPFILGKPVRMRYYADAEPFRMWNVDVMLSNGRVCKTVLFENEVLAQMPEGARR